MPVIRSGSLLLVALLLTLLGLASISSMAEAKKPNVLLIMTDDQRADDMRYMPKTKKILLSQGFRFQNSFAPFPLCCPARMSVMTGQSAHNHGVDGNFPPEGYYGLLRKELANTLPRWLQREGYLTAHVGKFLNGYGVLRNREVPPGWDSWHGTIDQTSYDYFNFWINDNGRVRKYGDDAWNEAVMELSRRVARQEFANYTQLRLAVFQLLMNSDPANDNFGAESGPYIIEELGKRAASFVRQAKKKREPFFLQLMPPAPHREDLTENAGYRDINPRVPAEYLPRLEGLSFTKSPSYDEDDLSDKPSLLRDFLPLAEQEMPLGGQSMEEMIGYYNEGRAGSLMVTDDVLARLFRQLKRSGQWKNTLVIFTSDNGWLLGEHRVPGDKYLPFEESLRVPLLLSGPGVKRGKGEALTINTDITKTILDATGARPGRKQEGLNLRALTKKKIRERKSFLLEATRPLFVLPEFPFAWDVPYIGLRTQNWKYVRWSYDEEELYDLRKDPFEINNLASNPVYGSIKERLAEKAEKLQSCQGRACLDR